MTNDLRENRIEKSAQNVKQLKKCILERLNPFSSNLKPDLLYYISNGQSANAEAELFLLNAVKLGEEQKNKFLEECSTDPKRLEQPIKK